MSLSKPRHSKRKYEDDIACRGFNTAWEEQFFFIEGKCEKRRPICLLCGATVAVPKKYNIERHFRQNHKGIDETYPIGSQLRSYVIANKKLSLQMQQTIEQKTYQLRGMIVASYEIALLLASKKKPYSDGEDVVKESLIIAARNLGDSELYEKFNQISLSQKTVQDKIDEMAENISHQLLSHVEVCTYFSLAVCKSTDMQDISQICIFIRCIDKDFHITEELLSTERQHCPIAGVDVFDKVNASLGDVVDWEKLESICTDGTPAMINPETGYIALTEKSLNRDVFKFHCIIHLDAICNEVLGFEDVLKVAARCTNKLQTNAVNHQPFEAYFKELKENTDFYNGTQWLLKGKTLHLFYALRYKIITFLSSTGKLIDDCMHLKDGKCLNDLAFLIDVIDHLNHLNMQFQVKGLLYPRLVNIVNAFTMKLTLFAKQLQNCNLDHFEHLKERQNLLKQSINLEENTLKRKTDEYKEFKEEGLKYEIVEIDYQRYKEKILVLKDDFEKRFQELSKDKHDINLFLNPFSTSEEDLFLISSDIQMEVIELKSNVYLQGLYKDYCSNMNDNGESLISFWALLPQSQFPNLRKFSQRYTCRFGTTQIFQKVFSWVQMKNKQYLHFTDEHLRNLLQLSTTNLKPRINEIIEKQQIPLV